MRHRDERMYRKPQGKPSLEALKSQLIRCRQDYERLSQRHNTTQLCQALREKIVSLEAEIARVERIVAQQRKRDEVVAEREPGPAWSASTGARRSRPLAAHSPSASRG